MSFAEHTKVPTAKTRGEIEALVERYGATRFASGWTEAGAAINFVATGRMVRFTLPPPTTEMAKAALKKKGHYYPADAKVNDWKDAETRRRWRCLLLAIKSKLEVVETGIESFEQAFLANLVTAENITVFERIKLEESGVRLLAAVEATP